MDLVTALGAEGLVCVVGAGGKKSTLWQLAVRIDRAVVTATVRIPIFDPHVSAVSVTENPVEAIRGADTWPLGLVPEREGDRYLGYETETVERIAGTEPPDAVLVKADGARMREFKAPNDAEPRIPTATDTVLPLVSAHVVGKPLTDDYVHRVDRVAALTDLSPGEEIRPDNVARVVTSPNGGCKDVPDGATVVPVVNKVDDDADEEAARRIASAVLATDRVDRVALTRMIADDPIVAVLGD
ncbi:dehydrogenase [Halorientalis sp. IM1011]|uniref:selenium cofactor biosynthesis protein YqeC n=1 Tax=Halorientalis sp. IM1011 TaxID=1932360 RepID=UPI00097CC502|nr:selenium cofactor biosynthesis protein YqeC [Halorientalis sp. IM1011]AQL43266.1 dehydrogenase [Halorientalis sp. IM1011]